MTRFIWPLAIFAVLLALLGAGLRLKPQEIPSPFIGKPAPAFQLTRLESEQATIGPADLRGQVWVLNVWASWCASCHEEHPVLLDLSRQAGVPLIGLDYKDDRTKGRLWLDRLGNPYQHVAFDADGRVGIDYGVYGVPETFVIDKQGVIRMKLTGPLTREIVRDKLLPLIQELRRA
ncbi:DsbE family thiol:disulfide interchange protein [Aquabacterium soli]|uniref:DsbE family thiol:disulfide interchange protein n=1 Tax=Aquabacterium soli TaxID=2493092 RepID=A0A3R8S1H4_9BURK|nr:DsbE family thiol:disulfide interchange protein [Aquabacterium soli]RRS03182.1 DsbE family thiol:disulfide interchange protein [Aquabacterium soli]